jgi:hypothetical protein
LSGSSIVKADSKYFRVEMESVRKIFDGGEGETEWHDDWKKQHRPMVERVKKKLETEIDALAQKYSLLPWDAKLPKVREESEDVYEAEQAIKSGKPLQYQFRFERMSIYVAFAKLPAKAVRAELKKALGRHGP